VRSTGCRRAADDAGVAGVWPTSFGVRGRSRTSVSFSAADSIKRSPGARASLSVAVAM
jgi:hypothetical protein